MPAWLIQLIISAAIRLGLPWVLKHFPGLPSNVQAIIEELLSNLTSHQEEKKALVSDAKQKIAACLDESCKV